MATRRRLSLKAFKTEAKDGDPGDCLIAKGYACEVEKAVGDLGGERRLQFTTTTGSVDRSGDTVNPAGCTNLKSFHKTGVVLWAHDSSLPPIARPIKAWREDNSIKSVAEFMPPDMDHPLGRGFGNTVYRYFLEGFMKSVSIGFLPSEWKWSDEEGREYGIDFQKWEKLEFSPVPIPANREAVVELAQKGLDMRGIYGWATKCLDGGLELIVPRELIEDAHKGLAEIYGDNPTISIPRAADPAPEPAQDPAPEPTPAPTPDPKAAGDLAEIKAELAELRALVEQSGERDEPAVVVAQVLRTIIAGEAKADNETRRLITAAAETLRAIAPAPADKSDPTDAEISKAIQEIVKEASDEAMRQYTGEVQ